MSIKYWQEVILKLDKGVKDVSSQPPVEYGKVNCQNQSWEVHLVT